LPPKTYKNTEQRRKQEVYSNTGATAEVGRLPSLPPKTYKNKDLSQKQPQKPQPKDESETEHRESTTDQISGSLSEFHLSLRSVDEFPSGQHKSVAATPFASLCAMRRVSSETPLATSPQQDVVTSDGEESTIYSLQTGVRRTGNGLEERREFDEMFSESAENIRQAKKL
jgi:hypothetical protein